VPSQRVLCIERAVLASRLGHPLPIGFTSTSSLFRGVESAFLTAGSFRERASIEEDSSFLQMIVSGVVTDGEHILALWRKDRKQHSETFVETRHNRLIALFSGGHVDPLDGDMDRTFFLRALLRELEEELTFSSPIILENIAPAGVIYRDATLFDRVHVGLIFRVVVSSLPTVAKGNDEHEKIAFLSPEDLPPYRNQMEGWGHVLTDAILAGRFPLQAHVGPREAATLDSKSNCNTCS
jgi:predicted NUDIX family phosphoesterase